MIKEKAMELVAALRSGKYAQTKNTLRDEQGFCCLGVACDISGLDDWSPVVDEIDGDERLTYHGQETEMPASVRNYFGFYSCNGAWRDADKIGIIKTRRRFVLETDDDDGFVQLECLSMLNDYNWTFEQIADFIEQHWESL
jgi:hypothetical protein